MYSEDVTTPLPMSVQDERQRLWRRRTQEAIALAMENRWGDAVTANRDLLILAPDDVEAWNRLGRALLEVGDCAGAEDALEHSLAISPGNGIARKNMERLARLKAAPLASGQGRQVDSSFFIEESSKTAKVTLTLAPDEAASLLVAAGEPVELSNQGGRLAVYDVRGRLIGFLTPSLGSHLLRLMEGGNRYQGAVFGVGQGQVTILLREVYQHPPLRRIHSFSSTQRSMGEGGVVLYGWPKDNGTDILDRWLPTSEPEPEEEAVPRRPFETWEREGAFDVDHEAGQKISGSYSSNGREDGASYSEEDRSPASSPYAT